MAHIPITFTYGGKTYRGHFSEVHGAAAQVWHLMIDNYYYGQLIIQNNKFGFHGNRLGEQFESLAENFGEIITAWYE